MAEELTDIERLRADKTELEKRLATLMRPIEVGNRIKHDGGAVETIVKIEGHKVFTEGLNHAPLDDRTGWWSVWHHEDGALIEPRPVPPEITKREYTDAELIVMERMIVKLSIMEREDIIGAIMKIGGFRELSDKGIVDLAHKIEWGSTADGV